MWNLYYAICQYIKYYVEIRLVNRPSNLPLLFTEGQKYKANGPKKVKKSRKRFVYN